MITAGSFSGGGGSSEGMKQGGADVRWACEFIPAAAETYRANHPETVLDTRDIRRIDGSEIREICGGRVELFEGSPPCSSFSSAGAGARNWGKSKIYSDTTQRTDDLIGEWLRVSVGVAADMVLMENVVGLTRGLAKYVLASTVTSLRDRGYRVRVLKLDASVFGVPQSRPRIFIVGSRVSDPARIDLERWRVPARGPLEVFTSLGLSTVTVSPSDPRLSGGECNDLAVSLEGYAIWKRARFLEPGTVDRRRFNLMIPDPFKPVPTITATGQRPAAAGLCHWSKTRKFSPNELKALFGYPTTYILTGTHAQRLERICRSVCPPVYKALVTELRRIRDE